MAKGLPPVLVNAVTRALAPDESIVWIAQPVPAGIARRHLGSAIFGLPWTAFFVWWTVMGARADEGYALLGLPLIALGVSGARAPLLAMRAARRSVYVISDRRALVISTGELGRQPWPTNTLTVRSYEPDQLRERMLVEVADGVGDVVFRTTEEEGYEQTVVVTEGFLAVPDAHAAERALANLRDPSANRRF